MSARAERFRRLFACAVALVVAQVACVGCSWLIGVAGDAVVQEAPDATSTDAKGDDRMAPTDAEASTDASDPEASDASDESDAESE